MISEARSLSSLSAERHRPGADSRLVAWEGGVEDTVNYDLSRQELQS
jgi:hypothetical protein